MLNSVTGTKRAPIWSWSRGPEVTWYYGHNTYLQGISMTWVANLSVGYLRNNELQLWKTTVIHLITLSSMAWRARPSQHLYTSHGCIAINPFIWRYTGYWYHLCAYEIKVSTGSPGHGSDGQSMEIFNTMTHSPSFNSLYSLSCASELETLAWNVVVRG